MSPTILCADADRRLCQILARALGIDGLRVAAAHDAEAALRAVEGSAPALVVVDLGLPGRDGLSVLAAIRARKDARSEVPALFLSATAPTATQVERARRLRASAILMKPVALENLAGRIRKLLPPPAGAASGTATRPRAIRSSAPLRGTLQVLPIPALFHEAHGLRACGVLRFEDGPRRKEIEFVDGRAAFVRSNVSSERLGEWLLRNGRTDRRAVQESIRRMQRGEGRQGEVLRAMQVLSEEDLAAALRDHAEDKLFELFAWTRGRFELVLGARLERASALSTARSPADVIRLGVATRFAIERIDAVLRQHVDHVALAGSNPFYSFQEIELTDADVRLLAEAEHGVPVHALLKRAPATRRTAYALLETGLLELREGAALRKGGPAARVRLHVIPAPDARSGPNGVVVPMSSPRLRQAPATRAMAAREATANPPSRSAPAAVTTAASPAAPMACDSMHYAANHEQRAALAALLVGLRRPSPFDKLGLRPDATPAEVRRAYTELAKRAHPDRFAAASEVVRDLAEEAFREITRAYQLLADPARLEQYRQDPNRDAKDTEAVEEAQRALAAEQEFQAGESRLRVYDWAGALAHFERASELYPDEGEYLAFCGWAYYLTHGHDERVFRKAFTLVKRGAELAPDRDKPYLFLGRLAQAAGRLDLAERMFATAVEKRPDCTEALRELRLLSMRKPKKSIVGRLLRLPGSDAVKRSRRRN